MNEIYSHMTFAPAKTTLNRNANIKLNPNPIPIPYPTQNPKLNDNRITLSIFKQ